MISKRMELLNHFGAISNPKWPYTLIPKATVVNAIKLTGCIGMVNNIMGAIMASKKPSKNPKEYDAQGEGLVDL